MIKCYEATERQFNHNGIKVLKPLFAEITNVHNGDYYVEFEDLLENLEYYQKGMIIRVDTPWGVQGFRCDNPLIQNNRIYCKAWHLFYDSENYVVMEASSESNCNDALNHYNASTDTASPFTVTSDISGKSKTEEIRRSLFDVFSDLTNVYNGHWVRDNFSFGIMSSIGQDRGVVLAHNKNITAIKVDENWDDVCTKILPCVKDGDKVITLDEGYVELSGLYDIPYTKVLEFKYEEKEGESAPNTTSKWKEWLRSEALRYLEANKLPKVNYTISAKLDNVSDVGDIIHVKHPKCNVDITTNVISVKYDAIAGKYTSIEFGNFRKQIKNLVSEVASITKVVGGEFTSRVTQTESLIAAEVTRATAAEGDLSSRIKQNADGITAEVNRAKGAEGDLSSRITQTSESITAEVNRSKGVEESLSSRITQTAGSITSEIDRATAAEGNLSSKIAQTDESITAEVNRSKGAEEALSGRISVQAGRVALLVDENGNVKGSIIVEAINGQSQASISADKIKMTGTTTFLTPDDVGKNGTTVIDGGRIDTNTLYVAADHLGGQLVVGDMLVVTIPENGVAGSVKIGGFDVTKNGLSHNLINIGTSGIGLGAAVADMASENVNHATWISPYGKLISYQPILYEMTSKGTVLFTGDSGNIVQFAIPIQASELTVNGVDFKTVADRVKEFDGTVKEEWTFSLDNGLTVTKAVLVG